MSDESQQNAKNKKLVEQSIVTWGNAGILGFHMVTGPLLGVFLGYYADQWLDSRPVCIAIGLIMGLIAGGLNMYRDIRRILRELDASDKREKLRRLGQGLPPVPAPAEMTAEERAADDADPSGLLPGYGSGQSGEEAPSKARGKDKN